MVPKIAGSGKNFHGAGLYYLHDKRPEGVSFKGAGQYALHDKKAQTTERIEFTHVVNVSTQDAETAIRRMAWTAMHQAELKKQAGVKSSGRALEKPVYAYSLSWHPDEKLDKATMLKAGLETLKTLGLAEHEALIVAHNDRPHPHIHVIVNRVHPVTGKAAKLSNDRIKLSQWAQDYELKQGRIYCEQRLDNNQERQQGQWARGFDNTVTRLYRQSDSGKSFAAALWEQGYVLAQGDRRTYVVLDGHGKAHNPVRLIDGIKTADFTRKLADLDPALLPSAKTARHVQKKQYGFELWAQGERAKLQSRQHDEQIEFDRKDDVRRDLRERELDAFYGPAQADMKRQIAALEQGLAATGMKGTLRSLTGRNEQDREQIAALKKSLENAQWRKQERRDTLQNQIHRDRQTLLERQERERGQLEKVIERRHSEERELAEIKNGLYQERQAERDRDPAFEPSRGHGLGRERTRDRGGEQNS